MPAIPRDVDSGTPEAGTSGTPAPDDHKHVLAAGGVRLGQAPTIFTTLSAAMDATQTTATVVSTAGYPSPGTLLIDSEAMTYTGITATSFTGLTRGALGTTAASHSSGAIVKNYLLIALSTSTTPRMVITGEGKVGIGTTNPMGKLDITATGDGTSVLKLSTERAWGFQQESTGASSALRLRNTSGQNKVFNIDTNGSTQWRSATGGTKFVKIDHSTGNVGIGTVSPGGTMGSYNMHTKLDVVSSSTQAWLRLASGVTGEDETGIWLHPFDFTNAGWMMGTNNDGKLRLGYGSGADEGAAVTNTKDGSSGITIETDGTIKVGTKLKLLNEGREIIGTDDATSMKVDINPVMRTEGMIKVQVGGTPGNPINVPADYCRGIEVGGYVTGETFDAVHVSLDCWQNYPNETGAFIAGITSYSSGAIWGGHCSLNKSGTGNVVGFQVDINNNYGDVGFQHGFIAGSGGTYRAFGSAFHVPAGSKWRHILNCTGANLDAAAIVVSKHMLIQLQGMDEGGYPNYTTGIKYNPDNDKVEIYKHGTVVASW